jgi:hypothetical protein
MPKGHDEVVQNLLDKRREQAVASVDRDLERLKQEVQDMRAQTIELKRALFSISKLQFSASAVYTSILETALVAMDQGHVIDTAKQAVILLNEAQVVRENED